MGGLRDGARDGGELVSPPFGATIFSSGLVGRAAVLTVTANLQLRLRADLGVTLVSGKVSQWNDQSGNGRNFGQATADARPTYVSSAQSGKPGISFDGTDDVLEGASGAILTSSLMTAAAGSVYAAAKVRVIHSNDANKYNNEAIIGDITPTGNWGIRFRSVPEYIAQHWDGADKGAVLGAGSGMATSVAKVFTRVHDGVNATGRIDEGTRVQDAAGNMQATNGVVKMGTDYNGTSFLDVEVYEVLSYSAAHSVADQDSVVKYLRAFWKI
jgi:hypothetical protein